MMRFDDFYFALPSISNNRNPMSNNCCWFHADFFYTHIIAYSYKKASLYPRKIYFFLIFFYNLLILLK